ncbi:FMN-binding protein [Arthrobacter sp. MI7-26]|uniref:FMN-binding protein n=1 Tax=Arthrobacter sp. MI7-26 TaxID=2993653 RepID=UPI0022499AA8|nr:FMN-binding protein [Arthrobacter sp. MI7-26]MCX2749597.1 FMN-binding protein [Arthrobacter sp. MI7-26]
MRARSAILAGLASAAVLVIGWQAGNQADSTPGGTAAKAANPPSGAGSPGGTSAGPAGPSAARAKDGTFDGSQIRTRYGTVQVQAVISGGKITDVVPLQLTDVGSLSGEIDQQAVPMLKSEVLSSQSANVDTVGGATYTSEGYLSSLQAALDAANFKG